VSRLDDLKSRWGRDSSSRTFLPLAEEFRRLGRLPEAEKVIREGLQRHPGYHSARVLLGRTLLDLDRVDEAAAEFRAVLEAEPQNLLAGRLLAGIYRSRGNWSEALETYRHLQNFYPDDAEVRTQVYQLERGPEPAEEAPGSARHRAASPADDALATNTLAEIYLRQGLVDRALAVYEAMLHSDPDNQAVRRRIDEILGSHSAAPAQGAPVAAPRAPAIPTDPRRRLIDGLQSWLIAIQKG
jgi:tetratricopeptide (TPR) repeat protein